MLPRLEITARLRPVDLIRGVRAQGAGLHAFPSRAPYVAATAPLLGDTEIGLHLTAGPAGAHHRIAARADTSGSSTTVSLVVSGASGAATHQSRRHAKAADPTRLALTLTGPHVTAWTWEGERWVARARHALDDAFDVRSDAVLESLRVELPEGGEAGNFGQLGLRDVRVVTHADGTPLREDDGSLWLSATSAGPGFFDTAHTSIWRFDTATDDLTHSADLFFRRPDDGRVFGDHATHVVRDDEQWLVATSTWGDFTKPRTRSERRTPSTLRTTLSRTDADVLRGTHVLDTTELVMPTDGLRSIATWDPHLVHRDGVWWVGFVSAPRFFSFHPALANGPSLDDLTLVGSSSERTATEGTTLVDIDGRLAVLASDGRDGRRGQRQAYPIFDTTMQQVGAIDAPYPTNLPWPTLVREGDGWLLLAFNGRPTGGKLLDYGTHGDLVVMRG